MSWRKRSASSMSAGTSEVAARRSAVFNSPRRRLPEIPSTRTAVMASFSRETGRAAATGDYAIPPPAWRGGFAADTLRRPRFRTSEAGTMHKGRLEAFSDGVIAILITIMVLELHVPRGADLAALQPLLPHVLTYTLSFVFLGIYWNNHHHMLQAAHHVDGRILWANMHLLFWLSLVPFGTAWLGENRLAPLPVAVYGVILLFAGVAYYLLSRLLIARHGAESPLARAVGGDAKGLASMALYALAISL